MTDVLGLLDQAHQAYRREAVSATVALLDDLLGRNRQVLDVRIKPGVGALMVTVDDATIRLAMPSATQSLALRELCRRGPVILAMGIALNDGRAMLGFSGVDEDILISTRVSWSVTGHRSGNTPEAATPWS